MSDLLDQSERLDAFEGAGYCRVVAKVGTYGGDIADSVHVVEG